MKDLSNDVSHMLIRLIGASQSTFELSWAATGNPTVHGNACRINDRLASIKVISPTREHIYTVAVGPISSRRIKNRMDIGPTSTV